MINLFNKVHLDNIIKRDNAKLTKDYPKLSSKSTISFVCQCGNKDQKIFSYIADFGGAKCNDCIAKMMEKSNIESDIESDTDYYTYSETDSESEIEAKIQIKSNIAKNKEIKKPRCFTIDLLNEKIKQDGATLIGEYINLTKKSKINFVCKCGEQHGKTFLVILDKGGAICKKCTNAKMVHNMKKTNLDKYGKECSLQNHEIKDKAKTTVKQKYGVEYISQNPEIKEKILETMKETNIAKYGTQYPSQTQTVKDKSKKTIQQKYNVEFLGQSPEVKEKIKQANLQKYNSTTPLTNPEIRKKCQETMIQKFGFKNVMQNPIIAEKANKNKFKSKDYKLPSGYIITAQKKISGHFYFIIDYDNKIKILLIIL